MEKLLHPDWQKLLHPDWQIRVTTIDRKEPNIIACIRIAVVHVSEILRPYKSNNEFLNELGAVMEKDYGVTLTSHDLRIAGKNITQFLGVFLQSEQRTG